MNSKDLRVSNVGRAKIPNPAWSTSVSQQKISHVSDWCICSSTPLSTGDISRYHVYQKKQKYMRVCVKIGFELIGQTTAAFQQKYTTFWDVEADISFGNKGLLPGKCRGLKLQGATRAPHVYIERPMVATKGHETQEPVHAQSGCRRCPVFRGSIFFIIFPYSESTNGEPKTYFCWVSWPNKFCFVLHFVLRFCIRSWAGHQHDALPGIQNSNQNLWVPGWTYQRCGASGDFGRRCRAEWATGNPVGCHHLFPWKWMKMGVYQNCIP